MHAASTAARRLWFEAYRKRPNWMLGASEDKMGGPQVPRSSTIGVLGAPADGMGGPQVPMSSTIGVLSVAGTAEVLAIVAILYMCRGVRCRGASSSVPEVPNISVKVDTTGDSSGDEEDGKLPTRKIPTTRTEKRRQLSMKTSTCTKPEEKQPAVSHGPSKTVDPDAGPARGTRQHESGCDAQQSKGGAGEECKDRPTYQIVVLPARPVRGVGRRMCPSYPALADLASPACELASPERSGGVAEADPPTVSSPPAASYSQGNDSQRVHRVENASEASVRPPGDGEDRLVLADAPRVMAPEVASSAIASAPASRQQGPRMDKADVGRHHSDSASAPASRQQGPRIDIKSDVRRHSGSTTDSDVRRPEVEAPAVPSSPLPSATDGDGGGLQSGRRKRGGGRGYERDAPAERSQRRDDAGAAGPPSSERVVGAIRAYANDWLVGAEEMLRRSSRRDEPSLRQPLLGEHSTARSRDLRGGASMVASSTVTADDAHAPSVPSARPRLKVARRASTRKHPATLSLCERYALSHRSISLPPPSELPRPVVRSLSQQKERERQEEVRQVEKAHKEKVRRAAGKLDASSLVPDPLRLKAPWSRPDLMLNRDPKDPRTLVEKEMRTADMAERLRIVALEVGDDDDDDAWSEIATPCSRTEKPPNSPKRLRSVFDMFDAHSSGAISLTVLDQVLKELRIESTAEETAALLQEAELAGDDEVDFDEFCTLLALLAPRTRPWRRVC